MVVVPAGVLIGPLGVRVGVAVVMHGGRVGDDCLGVLGADVGAVVRSSVGRSDCVGVEEAVGVGVCDGAVVGVRVGSVVGVGPPGHSAPRSDPTTTARVAVSFSSCPDFVVAA